MNKNIELQRKCSELTSDIEDILHAASLNFKALSTEAEHESINTLHAEFSFLRRQLENVQTLVKERSPLFMAYLITRQIQQEEARVRKQRLSEYEDKISDQKRIITDKEIFFEGLLRPKRKRASFQTPEEFHQLKIREREIEEKSKAQQLSKDVSDVHFIKKLFMDQEKCRKKLQLEYTKSSSISQINVTGLSFGQIVTERVISNDNGSNKQNKNHVRSASMQPQPSKDSLSFKKENTQDNLNLARKLLQQIDNLKINNEQLHKVYDQGVLSQQFNKNQIKKHQEQYKQKNQELVQTRKDTREVIKKKQIEYQRVCSPHSPTKRSNSK